MLWHAEQPGRIPIVVDCLRSTDEWPHVAPSQPWHAQTAASVPAPVPVSLVSNSGLLREGLVSVLAPHIEVRLVQSYAGGLWPGAELPNPVGHVVLVDGGIGADAGQRWVRYWRGLTPPAHVLALELVDEGDTILDYIEAGAEGYTVVGASATDVAEAIRWAQQGLARSSPQLVARVFARLAAARAAQAEPPVPRALAPLTARELEVLRYVNQDYSNQEIAALLVVEVRTVKHHVHNILQKLKLRHRWDAARLAVEQGWLEAPPPCSKEA